MTIPKLPNRFMVLLFFFFIQNFVHGQGTRLLRQPTLSDKNIAFVYGADIWVVDKKGGEARRITSTAAVESDPHFSPDGLSIAFTSNRSGVAAVYTVSLEGGTPTRLTWYPSASFARGWTPDGKQVLYSSTRETAPTRYGRLWTVPITGGPSSLLPSPFGFDGSFAADGKRMVVDRVSRWDGEWRSYRGGQNTPLQVIDLHSLAEKSIPGERTYDFQPVWLGNLIYFLSDRDDCMNIWSFDPENDKLSQITKVKHTDIKWIDGNQNELVYEWQGYLYLLDRATNQSQQLTINVNGDFPWAETHWEDVTEKAQNVSLSPTGKRIVLEARGEIFTAPVENGDVRNITQSSDAADRQPIWSPDGKQIAWFSDAGGKGYTLHLASQDGSNATKVIPIGESKLAWEPAWSPDNKYIAFVDNKVRIQVITVATGKLITADTGGVNIERGRMGLTWSPDSKWLAYSRTAPNNFRRVTVWSLETNTKTPLTDPMADAFSPAWDRNGRQLYFLASTSIALGSGWANTSAILSKPTFGGYIVVLRKDDPSPFPLKSDEEPDSTAAGKKTKDTTANATTVKIDFANIDRRILALPIPQGNYDNMLAGPKGTVFIGAENELSKFTIDSKKMEPFAKPASDVSVSANGEKILIGSGGKWRVVATSKPPSPEEGKVNVTLKMELNRLAEWKQIFDEVWHYERDYFYDPNTHGRDWQAVWERYSPLVPYIRHRSDLTYVIDQVGGELSVGHSFVFGGDFPEVDKPNIGLLGADLSANGKYWQIRRIYTTESWNPGLTSPLAEPDLKVKEGDFILAIDEKELTAESDPYSLLVGKAGKQTILTINNKPTPEGAWKIKVSPIDNEDGLRQRAWVEDNRRKVDELSHGRLGYVWVPNTGGPGFVSFNRYYFAQQDKEGAVIDERFNGGGSLDDYMVDLMVRKLRASITNEVPGGAPFRLPAGILGPKVLLINEMAGSGGDFFPWVFRHQNVGPLIGTRTWGGLVKSAVHYALIDGGAITAPDNAVFDPIQNKWIAENEGIAPDIEQKMDAVSVSKGLDPQLERAVAETLKLLQKEPVLKITHPDYSRPAKN